jgi:hypothetical protein
VVYRIAAKASGETFKYGITSVLLTRSEMPVRLYTQLRNLGPNYVGEVLVRMSTRVEARALERLLNIGYYTSSGRLPLGSKRF